MMLRWLLILLLGTTFACDTVSVSATPLDAAECGQLHDRIHDLTMDGLAGPDRAALDAAHEADREDLIRECVEDPFWGRTSFDCAMEASSAAEIRRCTP